MKKWLITGASSGFGRLLAERVATDGDQVIAVARREDRLRELSADHDSVTPLAVDLTAPDVEQRLRTAIDAAGGLDILVNDAGYGLFAPVEQTPDGEARAVFDTNFFAPLAVLRAALPSLRKDGGRVLRLSSMISSTDFAATSHRVQPDETYAQTVGALFKEFAAQPREAFGEPSSVVEAILTAVAADEPPLRLYERNPMRFTCKAPRRGRRQRRLDSATEPALVTRTPARCRDIPDSRTRGHRARGTRCSTGA